MNIIVEKATNLLIGKSIYNSVDKEGKISDCYLNNVPELVVEVTFEKRIAKYQFRTMLKSSFLKFTDNIDNIALSELLHDLDNIFKEAEDKRLQEVTESIRKHKEKIEAEKEAAKLKKLEEQFERTKNSAINSFEELCNTKHEVTNTTDEYYHSIGWLAANIGTISAKIPDYLDRVFSAHFGEETHRTVVDTSRRTSGGFKPQWSYAFLASLKKDKIIPKLVYDNLNENKTKISKTDYIWHLIENHKFKFGKTQDIEAIRSTIPDNKLSSFDAGFNE